MSRTMEELYQIAADEAAHQKTVEFVFRCLDDGLSHERIARLTKLTLEQVKEIANQRSA